jgi:hypothetical protein
VKGTFAAHPLIPQSPDVKGGRPLGSEVRPETLQPREQLLEV